MSSDKMHFNYYNCHPVAQVMIKVPATTTAFEKKTEMHDLRPHQDSAIQIQNFNQIFR